MFLSTFNYITCRLREFAKMYNVIKNERNKCVNLIQTSTQRAGEMREKIKILHNEIEILQQSANNKERCVYSFTDFQINLADYHS